MQIDFKILSYKAQEQLKFKSILSQRISALANATNLKIKI